MKITINLSDVEAKALGFICADPTEWVENFVHSRAEIAINEIWTREVERMVADPSITSIPTDREAVVLAADLSLYTEV